MRKEFLNKKSQNFASNLKKTCATLLQKFMYIFALTPARIWVFHPGVSKSLARIFAAPASSLVAANISKKSERRTKSKNKKKSLLTEDLTNVDSSISCCKHATPRSREEKSAKFSLDNTQSNGVYFNYKSLISNQATNSFKLITAPAFRFSKFCAAIKSITVSKLFKRASSGFVAILLCVLVPIVLFGVKYSLDYATEKKLALAKKNSSSKRVFKNCAEEAALAVAKNWNPGLTLDQQYEAVLKVADAVYNNYPTHHNSAIGEAIPGLSRIDAYRIEKKGTFNPIRVFSSVLTSMGSTASTVSHSTGTKYIKRVKYNSSVTNNSYGAAAQVWAFVDDIASSNRRACVFDELQASLLPKGKYELIHHDIMTIWPYNTNGYDYFYAETPHSSSDIAAANKTYITTRSPKYYAPSNFTAASPTNVSSSSYTYRSSPTDTKVKVQIDTARDCIKVTTDSQVGYAKPAECRVDIVIAVPTNGAACNKDNRDASSETAGSAWYGAASTSSEISADAKATPIYQIGRACKEFVKSFYHIRGVNMGLIPYSGKVSLKGRFFNFATLYGDQLDRSAWTEEIPSFNLNYYNYTTARSDFYPNLRGATLYSTYGGKDSNLYLESYGGYSSNWSPAWNVLPIMCRFGQAVEFAQYGRNIIYTGDLLSTANPTTRATKFRRMNLCPCYMGYANVLSGKCERACDAYKPNPYYIIELTADLQRIYEFCNALYPFYDEHNVSNFLFIPVTWTANLFQSWSSDPRATLSNQVLSRETKTASGRKKVLILIVNKPDYFEQKELTYLGFNNDFSEFPVSESDCIRFDVNYSDTSKKFADGSSFNNTIAGPKKILKFSSSTTSRNSSSGYYECSSGSGSLTFPQKGLIKVVVEPKLSDTIDYSRYNVGRASVTYISNKYYRIDGDYAYYTSNPANSWSSSYLSGGGASKMGFAGGEDGRMVIVDTNGLIWVSTNYGSSFSLQSQNLNNLTGRQDWRRILYDNGTFIAIAQNGNLVSSQDGLSWTHYGRVLTTSTSWEDICKFKNQYYAVHWGDCYLSRSSSLSSGWAKFSTSLTSINGAAWCSLCVHNNMLHALNWGGYVATSSDGVNWTRHSGLTNCLRGIESDGWATMRSSTTSGELMFINDHSRYVVARYQPSTIQFTNIASASQGTTTGVYTIKYRQEFFIEQNQINNLRVDFNMKNIRLISAEITNRPYSKSLPNYYFSGSTDCSNKTGTVYIITDAKRPITFTVSLPKRSNYASFSAGANCSMSSVSWSNFDSAKTFSTSSLSHATLTTNGRVDRVRYSLTNAYISNATLTNQNCLFCARYNTSYSDSGSGTDDQGNSTTSVIPNGVFVHDGGTKKLSWWSINSDQNRAPYFYVDGDGEAIRFRAKTGNPAGVCLRYKPYPNNASVAGKLSSTIYNGAGSANIYWKMSDSGAYNTTEITRKGKYSREINVKNTDLWLTVQEINVNEGFNYMYNMEYRAGQARSISEGGIVLANNYLNFAGTGTLSVTVTPVTNSYYIQDLNGSYQKFYNASFSGVENHSITISPDLVNYVQQADKTYKISLKLSYVKVSNLTMDKSFVFRWSKIPLPAMSRYGDFSVNGRAYVPNTSYISGSSSFTKHWTYDSAYGYYKNSQSNGYYNFFYLNNMMGDFFSLVEAENTSLVLFSHAQGSSDGSKKTYQYDFGSILRLFQDHDIFFGQNLAYHDIYDPTLSTYLIMGVLTFPINSVLYYANFQSNTSGGITTYNPHEAARNATSASCSKLKESGAEIYIIKYRTPTTFKHPVSQASNDYDYTYLQSCATDSAHVLSATTESALKETLDSIAAQIKTSAAMKEAVGII